MKPFTDRQRALYAELVNIPSKRHIDLEDMTYKIIEEQIWIFSRTCSLSETEIYNVAVAVCKKLKLPFSPPVPKSGPITMPDKPVTPSRSFLQVIDSMGQPVVTPETIIPAAEEANVRSELLVEVGNKLSAWITEAVKAELDKPGSLDKILALLANKNNETCLEK